MVTVRVISRPSRSIVISARSPAWVCATAQANWRGGIGLVDRAVDLDKIVIGTGADLALARPDDARCPRAAEAEWIADREHPVADAQRVGIAEGHVGQGTRRVDPEHGEICELILS